MIVFHVLLAGSLLTLTGRAAAQDRPEIAKQGRKVCRGIMPTGSSIRRRVCKTKDEWARFDAEGRNGSEALRDRPQSASSEVPRG